MPLHPKVYFDSGEVEFIQPKIHIQTRHHVVIAEQIRQLLAEATKYKLELDRLKAVMVAETDAMLILQQVKAHNEGSKHLGRSSG